MPGSACNALRRTGLLFALTIMVGACSPQMVVPPEPPLAVRRGDEAFRYKEYEAAIDAYRVYLDQTEYGTYTVRSFYKSALASYRLGRYPETLKTLDELDERFPSGHWVQVDALRGDTELAMGNSMSALQAWEKGWEIADDSDRAKLRQRVVGVARDLNSVELARAHRLLTDKRVQRLIDQEMARRTAAAQTQTAKKGAKTQKGQKSAPVAAAPEPFDELNEEGTLGARPPGKVTREAAESAPAVKATAPKAGAAAARPVAPIEESEAFEAPPPRPSREPTPGRFEEATVADSPIRGTLKIGCFLPLSGRGRDAGERSLRAIRLVFGEKEKGTQIVLKDVGEGHDAAAAGFDDLSRDPNVLAVIGPLSSEETDAVAPAAETAHVPLLSLARGEISSGLFVMPTGMSRGRLVNALLEYVMGRVRLNRFGVVYPDDPYGKAVATAFRTEAERRGGRIVGTSEYHPGSTDFGSDARTILKWRNDQDLQAIFLPDAAAPAAGLARLLQREMPDVPLLGAADWEELADNGGTAINGVLFADSFYADSARPATRAFVTRFRDAYGETPGSLEAQAYDAAMLVKAAVSAGARSRTEFVNRLHALGPVEGAAGSFQITASGVQRRAFLLRVFNGKLQEIGDSEG